MQMALLCPELKVKSNWYTRLDEIFFEHHTKGTKIIPSVYEYSGLNLIRGDVVEAYGYLRHSEFKIKKMKIIKTT
jgi:tRNA(Ile2) C34 agmatinyltransferase TiaS